MKDWKRTLTVKTGILQECRFLYVVMEEGDDYSNVKITLDFILDNQRIAETSKKDNAYISAFSHCSWVSSLRELARKKLSVRKLMNHRCLKKEISETYGTLCLAEKCLRRFSRNSCDDSSLLNFSMLNEHSHRIVFYDICSGKGISSFLISQLFSSSTIFMIDFDKRMNLDHLHISQCANIKYCHLDVTSKDFEDFMRLETTRNIQENNIPIVFGLHLCGTLSTSLTSLFNLLSLSLPILILSPCCMPTRKHTRMRDKIRRNKWDAYSYWCMAVYVSICDQRVDLCLAPCSEGAGKGEGGGQGEGLGQGGGLRGESGGTPTTASGPLSRTVHKDVVVDPLVLSEKASFVCAIRTGVAVV